MQGELGAELWLSQTLAESALPILGLGVPLFIWRGGSAGVSSFMERGKEGFLWGLNVV